MSAERVVITGLGVAAPNGIGVSAFARALRDGRSGIGLLDDHTLPAALLDWTSVGEALDAATTASTPFAARASWLRRRSPRTIQVALLAVLEAAADAQLRVEEREATCGVVVAGHNLNQRYVADQAAIFAGAPEHLSPSFALQFLDSDHVGAVSEVLGAQGEGMTIGAASASGTVALVQGMRLVRSGDLDCCVVVGAMTDLSRMEISAFESLGALAGDRYAGRPKEACRPFDREREGFVYGQGCACLVLESATRAEARGVKAWGSLLGGGIALDGHRSTEPNARGEARAMRKALDDAGLRPSQVDYLNAHGTSSRLGDVAELEAVAEVFGQSCPWINSTKGLVGHGLSAAGVVEAVATLIQMRDGFVHASANLDAPIRNDLRFAPRESVVADARVAVSNSFGFGGFNASVVFGKERG